tara:strand:+ start:789 stop:1472 length:684 start_codon:yes stop_codon:yes gene_type:complete
MIDIPEYEGIYKYDNELNQVFSIKTNRYLKNTLNVNSLQVTLFKNGKKKKYTVRNLVYMCNPIENKNLVAILDYDNYKFDTELLQVYNLKTNLYLKSGLDMHGYYTVSLYKNGKSQKYGLHQLVYIINNPTEDLIGFDIDHIDNDRANNKIENLRKATRSDNCSNTKTQKNNKLGLKYIHKIKNGYYKFKLVKNKIVYSKNFKTIEETIEYRNIKVREICGEFANLG